MAEYDSGDGRWFYRPTQLPTLNFHQFDPHIKFSKAGRYSNYGPSLHHMRMEDEKTGNFMGGIDWNAKTGVIEGVVTEHPYTRLGVASTLFHEAKKTAREQGLAEPRHSTDRTEKGDLWAKAVGGHLPRNMRYGIDG